MFAFISGGDLWVMALQLRLAITDRLAFIATKDGIAFLRPERESAIPSDQGFFDLGLGFKYALIEDPENQFILTPALRMDIPAGNIGVFSGTGAGVIIPSVSGAKGFEDLHLIGSLGWRAVPPAFEPSPFARLRPLPDASVPSLQTGRRPADIAIR